ncbi:hypothetical protein MPSEU_000815000 [Mayamaea pseudoterrestris]|nr:hypothetical protein MPSEU_000815000 [Mayamaea pseudoterrestris]
MTLTKLVYTPHEKSTSSDHPHSFVVLVDNEAYKKWKKDPSIPLAQVLDDFTVFRYDTGTSGTLLQPSKRELEHVFGSERSHDEIVQYMLEHGKPHGQEMM